MADVDTGLGWYADESWLSSTAGSIGTLVKHEGGGGSQFPGQPISVGESLKVYKTPDGTDMSYTFISYSIPITAVPTLYMFGLTSGEVYIAWVRYTEPHKPGSNIYMKRSDGTRYDVYLSMQAGYPKVSYQQLGRAVSASQWYVPTFSSIFGALAALSALPPSVTVTVNYAKSTANYSVVCMCKWIVSYGGDVYCSPVLISSEPNNTLFTRDGATPSVNNTEHQYQGKTFYMRKAPLDTLTGEEELTSNFPIVDLSGVAQTNDTIFAAIAYQSGLTVGHIPGDDDPYAPGGTSEPGGGGGSFDNTSDQIGDSTTPSFSFASSGFCRIYNPNLSQLQSLANYLWTDTNFLQTVINHAKQLLEDPIEAIISLAMLPVAIPQGTEETVKVLFISTQVSMPPATTQYVEVDCGTYTLEEYYGSALDYNPYTQVDLFLPFIGQVSLNTDEVMGHTIGVKYRVDIVSGLCVAKVFVDNDCMYQFSGNCAIFMPLNSADFSSYLSAAMTAATALVSAGAGVAAGAAAAGTEAVTEPAIQTGGNLLTSGESLVTPQMALQYRVEESVRPMYSPSGSVGSPSASLGEMERKFINNSAAAVMGSKISFEHASHLAGNSGILGVRRPYLIINRPDMCNPEKYGKYNGRPCMMHLYLGNLAGYTEIQEIQLTGFSATNPELAEISKMLKGGVIF